MENKDLLIRMFYDPEQKKYAEAFFFDITATLIRYGFKRDEYETTYKDGKIFGHMSNQDLNKSVKMIAQPVLSNDIIIEHADSIYVYYTIAEKYPELLEQMKNNCVNMFRFNKLGGIIKDGV